MLGDIKYKIEYYKNIKSFYKIIKNYDYVNFVLLPSHKYPVYSMGTLRNNKKKICPPNLTFNLNTLKGNILLFYNIFLKSIYFEGTYIFQCDQYALKVVSNKRGNMLRLSLLPIGKSNYSDIIDIFKGLSISDILSDKTLIDFIKGGDDSIKSKLRGRRLEKILKKTK